MINKKTGVYIITCLNNQKTYIGQSINIYNRWYRHKSNLKLNRHPNKYLQNEWDLYGESMFSFNILEECSEEELLNKEAYWVNKYNSINKDKGFNFSVDSIRFNPSQNSNKPERPIFIRKTKKVEMYNLEGEFLKVFNSTREVCEETGFSKNRIQEVCAGKKYGTTWKKYQYKGYIFKYVKYNT